MNDFQNSLAVFTILFSGIALIMLIIFRKKKIFTVIRNSVLDRLRKQIGLSIEEGKKIHVSMGNSGVIQESGASALISLSILDKIYKLSSMSDTSQAELRTPLRGSFVLGCAHRGLPPTANTADYMVRSSRCMESLIRRILTEKVKP